MPLQKCQSNGKDGWRWGQTGSCYTYEAGNATSEKTAKKKAIRQAIAANQGKTPAEGFEEGTEFADVLETVDLTGVEIMRAGGPFFGQGSPPEGDFFTVDDLRKIADDSNAVVAETKPPNKIGHSFQQALVKNSGLTDGEMPAIGWLSNFEVDGEAIKADIKRVPKMVSQLIEAGAFRLRSPELSPFVSKDTGTVYENVVRGLSWQGAKPVAISTLQDVVNLYTDGDAARVLFEAQELTEDGVRSIDYALGDTVWDSSQGAEAIRAQVCAALNPGPGSYNFWVRDVDTAAKKALVQSNGEEGVAYVVSYSLDAEGDLHVSPANEWVMAHQEWIADSAVAASTIAAYESGGEALPADTTQQMPGKKTESSVIEFSEEQIVELREKLGLDETADSAKVFEALDELKTKAETPPEPTTPPTPTPPPDGGSDGGTGTPEGGAAALPEGMVAMEADALAELKAQAASGADANEKLRTRDREDFLKTAMGKGKFDPAQIEDFRKDYDENEELTRRLIDRLPDRETEVLGSDDPGTTTAATDEDDRLYEELAAWTGVEVGSET